MDFQLSLHYSLTCVHDKFQIQIYSDGKLVQNQ